MLDAASLFKHGVYFRDRRTTTVYIFNEFSACDCVQFSITIARSGILLTSHKRAGWLSGTSHDGMFDNF